MSLLHLSACYTCPEIAQCVRNGSPSSYRVLHGLKKLRTRTFSGGVLGKDKEAEIRVVGQLGNDYREGFAHIGRPPPRSFGTATA